MHRHSILLLIILLPAFGAAQQFGEKEEKATSIGRIGLTITNIGVIGNSFRGPFVEGAPSMEFPIGSGIEHLFDGGLWIGASVRGENLVSTGAAGDDANGYDPGNAGYEFTYLSNITERSSLFDATYYDPRAVSHQDFVTRYSDSLTIVPNSTISITDHTKPLYAVVQQEAYAWNFPFADFFVILNFRITNHSIDAWEDVYLGYWVDFVVRNVKVVAPRGTDFFSHGANGILDSLDMTYTYNYDADIGFADSYAGMAVLGGEWRGALLKPKAFMSWPQDLRNMFAGADTVGPRVRYQFWGFRSTELETGSPRNDAERYTKMSTSIKRDLVDDPGMTRTSAGNRLSMLSIGPIPEILPGETVDFVLGVVAAPFAENRPTGATIDTATEARLRGGLAENAAWALRAYNGEDRNGNGLLDPDEDSNDNGVLDRFRLPEPPLAPKIKVVSGNGSATIYWDKRAEASVDPITNQRDFEGYRLYKTNARADLRIGADLVTDLKLLAEIDSAGNGVGSDGGFVSRGGFEALASPVQFDGDPTEYWYRYSLDGLLNGWQYAVTVTAFDEGNEEQKLQPLESSRFQNATWAIPGTTPNDGFQNGEVFVYPNPYYVRSGWDGTAERDKKLVFANLPSECEIRIYTLSGEVVDIIHHDASVNSDEIRWFTTYGSSNRVFSGGEHAWDLISRRDQRLATGLYLFAVKDKRTGSTQRGKFAIIR